MKNTTVKSIKLKEKMEPDEFFEAAAKGTYSIGQPEVVGSGFMRRMEFPPLNKYKIVLSVSGKTVTVASTYNGAGGLLKETGMNVLTDGWSSILGTKEDGQISDAIKEIAATVTELLGDRVK